MIEKLWLNGVKKLNLIIKISGWFLKGLVVLINKPDSSGVKNTSLSEKLG